MLRPLRYHPFSREESVIGVFEFIVLVVLISTIGKVVMARQGRPALPEAPRRPEEILQLNDAITELNARLEKLEDERDFYRALLEPPKNAPSPPPPRGSPSEPG
jgi:hypothetical protein